MGNTKHKYHPIREPASEPSSFLCACVLRGYIFNGDPDVSLGVMPKARTFDKFLSTENSRITVLGGVHRLASDGTQTGPMGQIEAPSPYPPLPNERKPAGPASRCYW